jgi:hypothetical protein
MSNVKNICVLKVTCSWVSCILFLYIVVPSSCLKNTNLQCEGDPGDQYFGSDSDMKLTHVNSLPPGKLPGPKYSQTMQQIYLAEKFHENFGLYSLS